MSKIRSYSQMLRYDDFDNRFEYLKLGGHVDDIVHGEEWIFDPEFLITVTPRTHNALHYGNEDNLPKVVTARTPNDTKLW
jgi:hypothetical protein